MQPPCYKLNYSYKPEGGSMRFYETIFITKPDLQTEEQESILNNVKNYLTGSGCQILSVDVWGKRRLAYIINKQTDGFYNYIKFSAEHFVPKELEKIYNLNENIVRYMTVKLDKNIKTSKNHTEDVNNFSQKEPTSAAYEKQEDTFTAQQNKEEDRE